jgi:DnaK suppressor protein
MLDLIKIRKILLDLKEEQSKIDIGMDSLKSEKVADEVDVAMSDNTASLATRFITRNTAYLKRINQALRKIEDGSYGECEICGELISEKRLLARPIALLCVDCKEEEEKEEKKEKDKLKGGILVDWD